MEANLKMVMVIIGIIGGGGLIGLFTMIYRFGGAQATLTRDIAELKIRIEKLCETARPLEVCKVKIERAVEKAEFASEMIDKQAEHNAETENKLSELKGQVSEGFAQIAKGMETIQKAFYKQVG